MCLIFYRSGRESYGDAAVGWVEVRRSGNVYSVKAKITLEHNVKKKQYSVICDILFGVLTVVLWHCGTIQYL